MPDVTVQIKTELSIGKALRIHCAFKQFASRAKLAS
jgi:hypothetical protein